MKKNIVFSIDNNYVAHLAIALNSLFQHSSCKDFHIFILALNVSSFNKNNIIEWASSFCDIDFIDVTEASVKSFPINSSSISLATYLRLFISDLLPKEVEKALYLDSDILVLSNIDQFYNKDLSNHALAAIEDIDNTDFFRKTNSTPYFNAGVILFNISFLRKINFTQLAINFIAENKSHLKYHDQDVLNALLGQFSILVPLKWNLLDCFYWEPPFIQKRRINELKDAKKHPAIIHFSGAVKPWHKFCNHPYTKLYLSYQPQIILNCKKDCWDHFRRIPSYQKIMLALRFPRKLYYFFDRLAVKMWKALHD